jgi:hypothetical protein
MHKPRVYKPLVTGLVVICGVGYGTGYFKDVPTKALSLMATASSTTSSANFKMPDMVNNIKEYDLRPAADARRRPAFISPTT